jgi:hypothetical protein
MSDIIYFNASVTNFGDNPTAQTEEDLRMELSYQTELNATILETQSDYELSIVRVNLPSDCIDVLNITPENQSDYTVGLRYSQMHIERTCMLPLSIGSMGSNGHTPWNYRSQNDVIEAVNRSIVNCYYQLIPSLVDPAILAFTYSHDYSFITLDSSYTDSQEFTNYPSKRAVACSVTITKFLLLSEPNNISIFFGHENREVLLWSGNLNDEEYKRFGDSTIIFADYGLTPMSSMRNTAPGTYAIQPAEPLYLLSTAASGGVYHIRLEANDTYVTPPGISGQLIYSYSLYETDAAPVIAPIYSINSNGLLQLEYPQYYVSSNITLTMTKHLMRMLTFGAQSRNWSPHIQKYIVSWPGVTLTHPLLNFTNGNLLLKWEQFQNTKYRLNNCERILIVGRNLAVVGEFFDGNIAKNTIADFIVNTDSDMTTLSYSTDAGVVPFRRYPLTSNRELVAMSFDIFANYVDGSLRKIEIPPGTSFNMKILFTRK